MDCAFLSHLATEIAFRRSNLTGSVFLSDYEDQIWEFIAKQPIKVEIRCLRQIVDNVMLFYLIFFNFKNI